MFALSYSNSYNRLNYEKISPAGIIINKGEVTVSVLHDEVTFDFGFTNPESKFYYLLYFFSSDSMHIPEKILIEIIGSLV